MEGFIKDIFDSHFHTLNTIKKRENGGAWKRGKLLIG